MYTKAITILLGIGLLFTGNARGQVRRGDPPKQPAIERAAWILGTWVQQTARGMAYETWTRESTFTFSGKSYALNGKDTLVFETIQLVQKPEGLFYIPTVKEQNGGKPVSFKLGSISTTEVVFDNPKHDFPQKISYRQVGSDSLVAVISGTVGGKHKSRQFPMKKVQ